MENTVTSTGGGVVPGAGTARAWGVRLRARAVGRCPAACARGRG